MSSSQYYPIPRKRPIGELDPEFPSLPNLSFEDAQQFAIKSQDALFSVKRIIGADLTGAPSIFLPFISPHILNYPFRVKENSVFVIVTKSYTPLKTEINSLDTKKSCGLYVTGPVGVGKSYLLYLLAAEYRMNWKSYRVTYINDCEHWRLDALNYFLKELVTTFYNDTIGSKSIVKCCREVIKSENEETMMMKLMESLINYVEINNLQWIVICDQYNALYTHKVVADRFPFNLIDKLADRCGTNIKVIISASATNEGCPTEWRGWQVHDISNHRFDDDEFKVWCDHYHLENVGKVDPESEEAVDAFFWTGGVPYELRLLWDQPKERLMEKTILYRKKRINDMCEIHSKFCSRLSEEDRPDVMECVSRMLIGASHPEESIGINKELVDIIDDEDGHKIVTALNPVARRALLYYYAGMLVVSVTDLALVKSLRSVTALALQRGYYTNDMKGKITVNYITTMLELSKRFSFQWKKATNIDISTVKSDLKEIGIQNIIHFSGNKLPLRNSFYSKYYGDNRISTLFIPKSPNSGGPDFLIWDPFEEVLMAFQVILKQPFPKIDTDSDNCKMWLDFCFGSLVKKPMKVYWIIPENCAGIPKTGEERAILLDGLHEDFPALKKLTL